MIYPLKIEIIGNHRQGMCPAGVWIVNSISDSGLEEILLNGNTDYSNANSVGSRGVFRFYFLKEGIIYHVKAPIAWKRFDDYYCQIINGHIVRAINFEEMLQWLNVYSV